MKTKIVLMIVTLLALAAFGVLAANPHMGTWKLNEAKSRFAHGTMARNNTVVYEAAGDMIKVTVDGTDATGKHARNEWTGKFDGKDYPVTGDAGSDTLKTDSSRAWRRNHSSLEGLGRTINSPQISRRLRANRLPLNPSRCQQRRYRRHRA